MAKRVCKYCLIDITDKWPVLKTICTKEACREKHYRDVLLDKKARASKAYIKKKKSKIKNKTCLRCRKKIPVEQDIRRPICLDPACIEWWNNKRETRRLEVRTKWYKNKVQKNKSKPKPKKKIVKFSLPLKIKPEDYFDQEMFEKQQAEFNKPNGRTCEYPSCNKKLFGNYRKLCPMHNQINEQKADGILWDTASVGGRLRAGRMG
jgi:hypothetical protein